MDGQLHLHAGLGDYKSFRPNLHSTKSSARVTSDPEKRPHLHKHKSHHHHHRDRDERHRHSASRRQAAKEAVQSAIQPPTSFGDLLKQARGSKDPSPSHSRKGSVVLGQGDRKGSANEGDDSGIKILPRKPLSLEDIEKEVFRVKSRERDLRTALQSLSDQSLKTSRRLDDTYYSILEKVSVLRQTIGTLQELSGLTNELQLNFESDTKVLVKDVTDQVETFDNFDSSQRQVSALEVRIKAGKEKAEALKARLSRAKQQVDAKALSEAQWQATNSHRLRMFWGILASIFALVFALVLFHQFKAVHPAEHAHPTLDFASRTAILEAPIPDIAKEAIIGPFTKTISAIIGTSSAQLLLEDDERLRIFDEL